MKHLNISSASQLGTDSCDRMIAVHMDAYIRGYLQQLWTISKRNSSLLQSLRYLSYIRNRQTSILHSKTNYK